MRLQAPVMTFQIVLDRAVLGVRHHHLYLALSVLSMLLLSAREADGPHSPPPEVTWVAVILSLRLSTAQCTLKGRLGAHFALTDQRGIRVGGGQVSPIELALAFTVFGQFLPAGPQVPDSAG